LSQGGLSIAQITFYILHISETKTNNK